MSTSQTPAEVLTAYLPPGPPSWNDLYRMVCGVIHLTREGKEYKNRVLSALKEQWLFQMKALNKEQEYEFGIIVGLPYDRLYCKGYPGKAADRFRALDASNFIKLIEDSVAKFIGLNDSHNFRVVTGKKPCEEGEGPYVVVWLRPIDPRKWPEWL